MELSVTVKNDVPTPHLKFPSTLYVYVATGVLGISCAAKAFEVFTPSKYLMLQDPVFQSLTRGHLITVALLLEVAAVFLLSSNFPARAKGYFCLWLAVCFSTYHLLLAVNQPSATCPCLGHFLSSLGWSARAVQVLVYGLIASLFLSGIGIINSGELTGRRQNQK